MERRSANSAPPQAPATTGACVLPRPSAPADATVSRIPADLLQRLEAAAHEELRDLLDRAPQSPAHPPAPDPVEASIAWDLAAGY
ncbi:hypothetical protein MNO14_08070 [Luteimonas sp. S4-F44]|uniref:hypothetical protein n=1 Tax=Luteimonas sp. S4-F44 TaxID=2925842 RepID=UPI001F52C3F8|nr:hypothetical protein [Luteimonas sp. S4-F44]UNK43991.1 hypothetical protein MNO14_08070 [Luteimonas sp. S4-F44]